MPDAQSHRGDIASALIDAGVPHWILSPHPKVTGQLDQLAFAYPEVVQALNLFPLDADEPPYEPPTVLTVSTPEGTTRTVTTLDHLLESSLIWNSQLPQARAYVKWMCHDFIPALSRHGYYDPETGHQPPPGQELEAMERREEGRDLLNALLPGLGDVSAGQRPSTEEGRRLLWHRTTDQDAPVEWVNDADLPLAEEEPG
jgi:hypothetical protein